MSRRILHVAESTQGGLGVCISQLALHQVKAAAEVAMAVPSEGPVVSKLVEDGVRHYRWEAVAQPGPSVPAEIAALRAIVTDFDPDLVHLHSSKAGLVGRLVLRGRRPTVMQPHAWSFFAKTGAVRLLAMRWERLAARWTDVIVCVSEDEHRAGREAGIDADYRVLRNGIDLDHFSMPEPQERQRARRGLGLGDEPLAVCVGRLHRQKNQTALLEAWPAVRALVPDARLALVGEGPDREALERRAGEGVHMAGPTGDVRPWLDAANVIVQPSLWEAGMSLAAMEAMARGRSVVATDVAGMREGLEPDAGAVVAQGDTEGLANAIVERLASSERADAEGRAGRRRVEDRHDVEAQHAGLDRVYGELLRGRNTEQSRDGDRLRVLVVHPYGGIGGAESWLLRLLDAAAGLDVEVVMLKDGPLREEFEARGIAVEVYPVGRNPTDVVAPIAWLARRLRRDPPDVVLGNILKAQLVAGPAGRIAGVPTVWAKQDHGYDRTLAIALGRVSTRVIGAVEELAAPTRRRDAVIIPPPRPDIEPAPRAEARQHLGKLGIEFDDAPIVVMAGRLVPFKGVDDAIRALALAPAKNWRLVVAGEDDHAAPGETERLRRLAADLGVSERVLFTGHIAGVAHWLAAFDALAVLTKPGARRAPRREGFGTAAFEAMLAGVPVIAVRGGAVVRRLEGRAGIGVPPANPQAVADALAHLSDPDVRSEAGRAGQEIVRAHPDVQACASLLVDVLRDAARSGQRKAYRRRSATAA